jgi:hypothetical protein
MSYRWSFYEGVGVGVLKMEESELLCTDRTALLMKYIEVAVFSVTIRSDALELMKEKTMILHVYCTTG